MSEDSRYTAIRDAIHALRYLHEDAKASTALAALDALTADLAELELVAGEYDEMVLSRNQAWEELERVEAEAYVRGYERASALAMADLERVTRDWGDETKAKVDAEWRAERAESSLEAATEALRKIAESDLREWHEPMRHSCKHIKQARAFLAAQETP